MKKLIFPVLFLTISIQTMAQSDPGPRIKISDFIVQWGFQNNSGFSFTLDDYKALAPGSALLANDFSSYTVSEGMRSSSGIFSGSIGLRFLNSESMEYKSNPVLRVGFYYTSGSSAYTSLHRQQSFSYDTLTSSQSGNTYLIDSIASSFYEMNYHSENLGLTASVQFSTNPEKRLSLYAGAGITAAFSFNASTNISNTEYSMLGSPDNLYIQYPAMFGEYSNKAEGFENKTTTMFSAGLPMGIDFRLGNQNPFWSQLHIVYEIKPCISTMTIPELKTYTGTSVASTLGLRVTW